MRPDAPTVEDVGHDPDDLGCAYVEGFAGPVLDGAVTDATLEVDVVGFETPVLET